jgi:hypothetical protein
MEIPPRPAMDPQGSGPRAGPFLAGPLKAAILALVNSADAYSR